MEREKVVGTGERCGCLIASCRAPLVGLYIDHLTRALLHAGWLAAEGHDFRLLSLLTFLWSNLKVLSIE